VGFGRGAMSVLKKIGIVLSVIIFFFFGLLGTVYLSLRTPEVKVPDIVGKDRYTAEAALENTGLKLRVRGTTPSLDQRPDTVLNQVPEAGQVVKSGIEVAVQVSRAPKEGENVSSSTEETKQQEANKNSENQNTNQSATANQNQNQNQNKPKNKNKNSNNSNNKNSKNSNNANNANRNANNKNANTTTTHNANASNGNRTTNTTPPNTNRSNTNANKRPPTTTPGANKGTP
jgi:hypothetical protein